MKFIFFFVFVYAFTSNLYGQKSSVFEEASERLRIQMLANFTYRGNFQIERYCACRKKFEKTLVFSKNTHYSFDIDNLNGNALGIIADLYDAERNLVASNFDGKLSKNRFLYEAKKTGIFYLHLRFGEDRYMKKIKDGGVVVLGYNPNYNEGLQVDETSENVPDSIVENTVKPSEDAVEKQLKIYGEETTEKQHLEKNKTYRFYPQPVTDFLQTDIDTIADLILFDASGKKK